MRLALATLTLCAALATSGFAQDRVERSYGCGMDCFGGGVTYGTPTARTPQSRPGWATPWPQSRSEPASDPYHWNGSRWRETPGYCGGEANYHGVFDPPPRLNSATPRPLSPSEPVSDPYHWNGRRWRETPGYFGGEAAYHGVFDPPPRPPLDQP